MLLADRPFGPVAVRLVLAFSDEGARSALRRGDVPTRRRTCWVTPEDDHWGALCELIPSITDGTDQELVVGAPASLRLINASAGQLASAGGASLAKPIDTWPAPRLVVERATEPARLDEWPRSLAEVVQVVRAFEGDIRDMIGAQTPPLIDATTEWLASADARIAGWQEQLEAWRALAILSDPERGLATRQLDDLARELGRLRGALRSHPLEDHVVDDRGAVRPTYFLLDQRIVAADDRVHELLQTIATIHGTELARTAAEANNVRALEEARDWAARHGSSRLRKAAVAGVIGESLGIYRDERLRAERPGWMWVAGDEAKALRPAINPSDEALETLLRARDQVDPDARLLFHPKEKAVVVLATFLGRGIWQEAEGVDENHWLEDWLDERDTRVVSVAAFIQAANSPWEEDDHGDR
jgi:hypothetical protein